MSLGENQIAKFLRKSCIVFRPDLAIKQKQPIDISQSFFLPNAFFSKETKTPTSDLHYETNFIHPHSSTSI